MTELHEAAANNDMKTLQCVLVGSDIDIDAEDWDWGKRTALHIAASNGKLGQKCFCCITLVVSWSLIVCWSHRGFRISHCEVPVFYKANLFAQSESIFAANIFVIQSCC